MSPEGVVRFMVGLELVLLLSDVFGSIDSPLGTYQMCRKCGGDFSVSVGTIEINVTI